MVRGPNHTRRSTKRRLTHATACTSAWMSLALISLALMASASQPALAQQPGDAPDASSDRGLPRFEDTRPLPETIDPLEAERARRAAEEKARLEAERRAQEAEQRRRETEAALEKVQQEAARRAEEARRSAAAEAEARRKAEDNARRAAAEAEARRKAENDARHAAAEAEARRKAEDDARRAAADAEARRLAEEQANRAAADTRGCVPAIIAKPLPYRRTEIDISAACSAGGTVELAYGPYTFTSRLDDRGEARALIDAFLPRELSVKVSVDGKAAETIALAFEGDQPVTKVAVVWRAPVNLDLHALEYTARRGETGHLWANAPSTAEAAARRTTDTGRGRGFLTMLDRPADGGDRAEIYTFIHPEGRQSGAVALSLDFESRATAGPDAYCGDAADASVTFTVHVNGPGRPDMTEKALIPALACGPRPQDETRFLRYAVPDLRLR